jgi:hypothetical protein
MATLYTSQPLNLRRMLERAPNATPIVRAYRCHERAKIVD